MFGEVTYDLTDVTTLSAGLRYSYDKKDYEVVHEMIDFDPLSASLLAQAIASNALEDPTQALTGSADESWSSVTGKVSLVHQLNESSNIYVTVGNGTKSGGFNPEPF